MAILMRTPEITLHSALDPVLKLSLNECLIDAGHVPLSLLEQHLS